MPAVLEPPHKPPHSNVPGVPTVDEINALIAESDARDAEGYTEDEKREMEERLDAAGWKTVTVAEFLDLTPEDMALIEVRRTLARAVRERREAARLSQTALAAKIGSSQSRVAFLEGNSSSVSLDLMIRAFLATGATQNDLARVLTVA